MIHAFILTCFCLLVGVFGDEVKSVMEGDSVTLYSNLTEIQKDDELEWWFKEMRIARIKRSNDINPSYDNNDKNQRFRDRLKINTQTADLTITDIRFEHTGLYELIINAKKTVKSFRLTAYAPLPVPVITSNKSHCAVSKCVLLCSVLNVRDVSLSWYKGNSLLSIISVSDLNIRLSLPLMVDDQDNNTYSCVLNNPIINQTQHYCVSDLCQPCSDVVHSGDWVKAFVKWKIILLAVFLAIVLGCIILYCIIKHYKLKQERISQTAKSDE